VEAFGYDMLDEFLSLPCPAPAREISSYSIAEQGIDVPDETLTVLERAKAPS
jgi:hypothetical protein